MYTFVFKVQLPDVGFVLANTTSLSECCDVMEVWATFKTNTVLSVVLL